MADRPYTVLSCAVSLDGYLDSPGITRLALSNEADFDRVDAVRAASDAILVGAATVRSDDPRLLVRSPARGDERIARGAARTPLKVTMTASGDLDPGARFFACDGAEKIVYCPRAVAEGLPSRLGDRARVVALDSPLAVVDVSRDLSARGVARLLVEGGGHLNTQFLLAGLADELQLVVAPLFVGDSRAHRFVLDGRFPWSPGHRADLAQVRHLGDVVLLRYRLSDRYDSEGLDR